MTERIVVLGAATALREVQGLVSALRSDGRDIEIVGVLDDQTGLHGTEVAGVQVLGGLDRAQQLVDVSFVFAIGSLSTQLRREPIFEQLRIPPTRFTTLIHPSADVDPTASIGHGCIIHRGTSFGPGSRVGNFVVVAVNSALGPDVVVEDFAMVTSFVLLLTGAVIRRSAYIGSMTCVLERTVVGANSRIGAGSVVNRDVPGGVTAVGNPMRLLGLNQP